MAWEAKAKALEEENEKLRAGQGGGSRGQGGYQGGYQGGGGGGYQGGGGGGGYPLRRQVPGSPDYTGCGMCGSMEHKGGGCPQNPRNRFQQGGFQTQQGGYSQGYQQGRFAQGGGGGFQQQPRFQGASRGAFVRIQPQQGAAGRFMPRAPGAPARPQGVYMVDSTDQLVLQEEQGAESGALEGKPGSRSRRGSQQRARDIVREGTEDLRT